SRRRRRVRGLRARGLGPHRRARASLRRLHAARHRGSARRRRAHVRAAQDVQARHALQSRDRSEARARRRASLVLRDVSRYAARTDPPAELQCALRLCALRRVRPARARAERRQSDRREVSDEPLLGPGVLRRAALRGDQRPAPILITAEIPMSPRAVRAWSFVHKWTGLIATVFLLMLCITGLPLIFYHEIDHWRGASVEPPELDRAPRNASLDAIVADARARRPGDAVQY